MSIRDALPSDIPRIVELGSQSLVDGPYAGLIKDTPEQSARLAVQVIENTGGRILLYSNDDGKVVGLLGFIISPHYFTGELTANEIMWYVEPSERKGGAGIKLLWAAEQAAKEMKAKYMGFTAPTADVSALYQRFGYSLLEVAYLKQL